MNISKYHDAQRLYEEIATAKDLLRYLDIDNGDHSRECLLLQLRNLNEIAIASIHQGWLRDRIFIAVKLLTTDIRADLELMEKNFAKL